MGTQDRGPEVVLDRYLAPVSSAQMAKVTSCQNGERCAEAAKPAVAQAPALPEAPATPPVAEVTPASEATPAAEGVPAEVAPAAPAPAETPPADSKESALTPPPVDSSPSAENKPAAPEQLGLVAARTWPGQGVATSPGVAVALGSKRSVVQENCTLRLAATAG